MTGGTAAALRVENVSKTFPGGLALDSVSVELVPGEVHGLVGGNGSGKSTLIKILAGVYTADSGPGTVQVGSSEPVGVADLSPDWARTSGLHFVHQDPAIFPLLNVAENIAIGRGSRPEVRGVSASASCAVEPRRSSIATTSTCARPTCSRTSVPRSARWSPSPARSRTRTSTRAASSSSTSRPPRCPSPRSRPCSGALRIFARSGQSVLFISHRTPEVLGLADRVTVLRDGKKVATVDGAGLTEERIVELIVGRELETLERDHHPVSSGSEGAILHARNLHGPPLNGVTMDLREREVLGIAGLVGCGRSELLKVLFGAYKVDSGTILLDGQPIRFATVGEAMNSGFAYVPEDRTTEASFAGMSVRENLSAANVGVLEGHEAAHGREQSDAKALIEEYGVRTSGDKQVFSTLSGGNQQKVIIARWLRDKPRVLLLDEPTHGVDIGARTQIYKLIDEAAEAGTSIILVSSDNEELSLLCDRVLIMRQGRVTNELHGPGIDPDRLGELAMRPVEDAGEQANLTATTGKEQQ